MSSIMRPGQASRAVPGNRSAIADMFAMAASFIRAGKPLPDELAAWLAPRLDGAAAALRDAHDRKLHTLAGRMLITRSGTAGNLPATDSEIDRRRAMVWRVLEERSRPGLKKSEAPERVAAWMNAELDRRAAAGEISRSRAAALMTTAAVVGQAWKDRKALLGDDLPELDS